MTGHLLWIVALCVGMLLLGSLWNSDEPVGFHHLLGALMVGLLIGTRLPELLR